MIATEALCGPLGAALLGERRPSGRSMWVHAYSTRRSWGRRVAGPTESADSARPPPSRVLLRRTVIAVVVLAIASVPFALFAVISGQVAAAPFAAKRSPARRAPVVKSGSQVGVA